MKSYKINTKTQENIPYFMQVPVASRSMFTCSKTGSSLKDFNSWAFGQTLWNLRTFAGFTLGNFTVYYWKWPIYGWFTQLEDGDFP